MGNLGGAEIVVILLVALVVLGPRKLPHAARQVGRALTELKRLSSGFQKEMREAMDDPVVEAEARAKGAAVSAAAATAGSGETHDDATLSDDTAADDTVADDTVADDTAAVDDDAGAAASSP